MSYSVACSCGVALESRLGRAYNEEAFRYFLNVERKRAEHSQRPFLLVLVSLKPRRGARTGISDTAAERVFSGLWMSVREVDFVGWLRTDRVAGAVLTQGHLLAATDIPRSVGERVSETLVTHVPKELAGRLHVRVLELRPRRQVTR